MKKLFKLLVLTVIFTGTIIPESTWAQSWGGRRKPSFWDSWSINGNVGLTSFFGDLSIYDSEIMEKLTKESGPAMSGIMTKYFNNRKFGIGGQLLYGKLKGANSTNLSFETTFIEYNFQGRVNLVNAIWPYNLSKFGLMAYGGVGQFLFNVTKYDKSPGHEETDQIKTGVPEFVYFIGMGMSYDVTEKIAVTMDIAMRQAQNDKLDSYVKNNNNDYYTHFNIGVTYYIDTLKKGNRYSRSGGGSTRGRFPGRLPMRRRR